MFFLGLFTCAVAQQFFGDVWIESSISAACAGPPVKTVGPITLGLACQTLPGFADITFAVQSLGPLITYNMSSFANGTNCAGGRTASFIAPLGVCRTLSFVQSFRLRNKSVTLAACALTLTLL